MPFLVTFGFASFTITEAVLVFPLDGAIITDKYYEVPLMRSCEPVIGTTLTKVMVPPPGATTADIL